jgi:hypothetical protein
MPFNLREQSLVDLGPFSEFLKYRDLLLESLVGCVHTVQQVGHVTEHNGVESNTKQHPGNCEDPFLHILSINVTKPNSG